MRRFVALLAACGLLVGSSFASPAAVGAHGACIGPMTKSAVFTYADRFEYETGFGDSVHYYRFKLTGTFCYDALGNAWAPTPTIKAVPLSGPYQNAVQPPYYRTGTNYAEAYLNYGVYIAAGSNNQIRIYPRLRINGTTGRFTATDTSARVTTKGGDTLPEFGPVFVAAALQ
jgi:hypothetical protein